MLENIFSIPLFTNVVDLSLIKLTDGNTDKKWGSDTETSFSQNNILEQSSVDYLNKIFISNLDQVVHCPYTVQIKEIWRNHYKIGDFQENHIHPKNQYSFIIYEKMKGKSKTVFVRPNSHLFQHCYEGNEFGFRDYYYTDNIQGDMIMFPSVLEHFVKKATEEYTTISGNLTVKLRK